MIWKRGKAHFQIGGGVLYERSVPLVVLLQRLWPNKTRYRVMVTVLLLIILALLGPYLYSRAMSASRALSVEEIDTEYAEPRVTNTPDSSLRVVCYNIAHGRGLAASNWDGGSVEAREDRLKNIAYLLRELDGDVVVLNEIDFNASWSYSVDQALYLAKQAGYPYCAKLSNLDFRIGIWSWRFGNAVLSRYPIVDAKEIDMPGYAQWETRLAGKKRALFCELDLGGQSIGVVAVHLSHRSEDLRTSSAEQLLAFAETYEHPLILAGDFNSSPEGFPDARPGSGGLNAMDTLDQSKLYQRLPKTHTGDPAEFTFRSDRPKRIIDWILVPKELAVAKYFVEPSDESDHRPVVVDILLAE